MSLQEESKENGKSERIKKYVKSDEAIADIIMNFIIDNYFKEKYQKKLFI